MTSRVLELALFSVIYILSLRVAAAPPPATGVCAGQENRDGTYAAVCTMDASMAPTGQFVKGETTTKLALTPHAVAPNMVKFTNTDLQGSWTGVYGQNYARFTQLLVYNVPLIPTSVQVSTNILPPEGSESGNVSWARCAYGTAGCPPAPAGGQGGVVQVLGLRYDNRVFWSVDLWY
ncbi:hypothetical protein M427DRAFT_28526 [Gonapodya prolifera JEL478]|uniref:Uncharacterized protein n=1 Tax=Gonapodya prolifera (strain JEL478) TaxID=1344416 RepID=A0A139AU12_GONPJ|nr:hypothetical protein M427DRAFT_28526 [Gonapodya prolifera JEL478]|eukprot:KXS20236.1 hypothetical protein M427DRAFT_28526 [Gonapodya prolifera JEL478]